VTNMPGDVVTLDELMVALREFIAQHPGAGSLPFVFSDGNDTYEICGHEIEIDEEDGLPWMAIARRLDE
jgi:hypothetical protein